MDKTWKKKESKMMYTVETNCLLAAENSAGILIRWYFIRRLSYHECPYKPHLWLESENAFSLQLSDFPNELLPFFKRKKIKTKSTKSLGWKKKHKQTFQHCDWY